MYRARTRSREAEFLPGVEASVIVDLSKLRPTRLAEQADVIVTTALTARRGVRRVIARPSSLSGDDQSRQVHVPRLRKHLRCGAGRYLGAVARSTAEPTASLRCGRA